MHPSLRRRVVGDGRMVERAPLPMGQRQHAPAEVAQLPPPKQRVAGRLPVVKVPRRVDHDGNLQAQEVSRKCLGGVSARRPRRQPSRPATRRRGRACTPRRSAGAPPARAGARRARLAPACVAATGGHLGWQRRRGTACAAARSEAPQPGRTRAPATTPTGAAGRASRR